MPRRSLLKGPDSKIPSLKKFPVLPGATARRRPAPVRGVRQYLPAVLLLVLTMALALPVLVPAGREALVANREEKLLLRMMKTSGAGFETASVTGWVKLNKDIAEAGDPAALAEDAAARLGLPAAELKRENWQNQYARGVQLEGKAPGGPVFSVLAQVVELPGGEKSAHVMISTSGPELSRARHGKQEINQVLDQYGKGRVAVTYAGKINRDLRGEELLNWAEKMMALAGAAVREKTVKDNLVSLTGLSPLFTGEMSYAGREVNLNVALRSNPAEHVTYVYVASPVIYTEY